MAGSAALILVASVACLLLPSAAAADGGLTASNDEYSVQAGGTLNVPAPGVLANDTNPSLLPMVAVIVTLPAHGTASLLATGALVYVPNAGFSGTDEFLYQATNLILSSTARVRIDVTPLPTPTPTVTPTATPTATPVPTATPTAAPTATPLPLRSPNPSASPSPSPTPDPAGSASPDPSASPSSRSGPDPAATASPGSTAHGGGGGQTTPPTGPGGSSGGGPGANGEAFGLPTEDGTIPMNLDLGSVNLGRAGALFVWAVPGVVLSVPGLLVILVIGVQVFGGLAWLPVARKRIGAFGFGRRRHRGEAGRG